MESRLQEWARWKLSGSEPRGEGAETDCGVARLPEDLRRTVFLHYLGEPGDAVAAAAARLPEWIVSRRLGRIHLMLAEALRAQRELVLLQREKQLMSERLAQP